MGKITSVFCCLCPLEVPNPEGPSQNKGQKNGQRAAWKKHLKKEEEREKTVPTSSWIKFRTMLTALSFCCYFSLLRQFCCAALAGLELKILLLGFQVCTTTPGQVAVS